MSGPPVAEVVALLSRTVTPARSKLLTGYYETAMTCYGVPVPEIHRLARSLRDAVKSEEALAVLAYAQALVDTGSLDARQLGYELIGLHRPAQTGLNRQWLERLGAGNDNWRSVDTFAPECAGPAWRQGQITDATVKSWATSKDQWWQRTALVATVALNRKSAGATGDAPRTLMICTLLRDTRVPQLTRALSWAVRELILWDRDAVEAFLLEHEAVLPALVKREVRTQLRTGTKSGKSRMQTKS